MYYIICEFPFKYIPGNPEYQIPTQGYQGRISFVLLATIITAAPLIAADSTLIDVSYHHFARRFSQPSLFVVAYKLIAIPHTHYNAQLVSVDIVTLHLQFQTMYIVTVS